MRILLLGCDSVNDDQAESASESKLPRGSCREDRGLEPLEHTNRDKRSRSQNHHHLQEFCSIEEDKIGNGQPSEEDACPASMESVAPDPARPGCRAIRDPAATLAGTLGRIPGLISESDEGGHHSRPDPAHTRGFTWEQWRCGAGVHGY